MEAQISCIMEAQTSCIMEAQRSCIMEAQTSYRMKPQNKLYNGSAHKPYKTWHAVHTMLHLLVLCSTCLLVNSAPRATRNQTAATPCRSWCDCKKSSKFCVEPWIKKAITARGVSMVFIGGRMSTAADYTGVLNRTPYIVTSLTIRSAKFQRLTNIFAELVNLKELDICCSDYLTDVDSDIFQNLSALRRIRFSQLKNLPIGRLQQAFLSIRSNNIETLVLENIGMATLSLTKAFFHPFRRSPLKTVVVSNLGMIRFAPGFTACIPSVACFMISSHSFVFANISELLETKDLRTIKFSRDTQIQNYGLITFDNLCPEPLRNSKEVLQLEPSLIHKTRTYPCEKTHSLPQNMRYIHLHGSFHITGTTFGLDPNLCLNDTNHVRYMDARDFPVNSNASLYGLLRLQYLNFQGTGMMRITCQMFCDLPSLNTLLLGRNKLGPWFERGNATYALRKMKLLSLLDLSETDMRRISLADFDVLTNISVVNLSSNHITGKSLNHSVDFNFAFLNLSDNLIDYLPRHFRNSLDKMINKTTRNQTARKLLGLDPLNYTLPVVDLSNNSLECSCRTVPFLLWFRKRRRHFYNSRDYTCRYRSQDVNIMEMNITIISDCASRTPSGNAISAIVKVVGGIAAVCVLSILSFFVHRHKQSVKYYIIFLPYITIRKFSHRCRSQPYYELEEQTVHSHDVFVLCSGDDIDLVRDKIKPELISREFTLLIGEESFLVGHSIHEQIERAMSACACVLLVLSTKFVQSPWLDYEATMVVAMKKKVVIVKLDDPPYRSLPPALIYLYRNNEVRQRYPADRPEDLPRFWSNVSRAITRMTSGQRCRY